MAAVPHPKEIFQVLDAAYRSFCQPVNAING